MRGFNIVYIVSEFSRRKDIRVNKSKKSKQNKGRGKSPKHFNTKTEHGDAMAKKQRRRGELTYGRDDAAQYSIHWTERLLLRPNASAFR